MAGLEQIELNRYHQELVQDVQHLVRKYCRIMSWEVPASGRPWTTPSAADPRPC